MNESKKYARGKTLTYIAISIIGAVTLLISSITILPTKLVWNASASVPIGLYWIEESRIEIGQIALIDLPEPHKTLADQRGFLPQNLPALKRIRGLKGDVVCRFNRNIYINSEPVAVALSEDQSGFNLPKWQGCQNLKAQDVFLLSEHPKSFDGRYFGIIKADHIIGVAVPIWTD